MVSVNRELIDPNALHGFILDFNDEWILMQRVFDFYIDGFIMVRRADITALQSKTTDVFQKALLEQEGSFKRVDFSRRLPEGGLTEFFLDFGEGRVIILEEETDEDDMFYIGFLSDIDEDEFVELDCFTGAGRFEDEVTLVDMEEITCISFESNYTLHYQRYFDRRGVHSADEAEAGDRDDDD